MSRSIFALRFTSISVASALALSVAGPGLAAPVLSGTAVVKSAAAIATTDVRWRGWGGGAFAAGVIGGLALGALAAPRVYYAAPPAYYGGYYGGPYYAAPTYSYYGYYGSGCSVYGGYGRPNGCW